MGRLTALALATITGAACGPIVGPQLAVPNADPPVAVRLAGDDARAGTLAFRIVDADDRLIPGRLTFVAPESPGAPLFPAVDAAPPTLAVRDDVVYSLNGEATITVPAGRYELFASRGLEWSIDSTALTVEPGGRVAWTARLRREIDTTGWISGDFHLHTLTHSGHGDSNMTERIVSLVGEGVEFAVATDHNHNTDYRPTMETLDAGAHLTAVTGNEVSTPIGHFNVFPLEPDAAPVEHRIPSGPALFALMRELPNPYGIVPIVQVNHPRWGDIDYFGQTGLDPVAGTSDDDAYGDDFDAIELLNENVGWGYHDPAVASVATGTQTHHVLQDWYNLLNRGHRAAAVGNSDSHHVRAILAGYPRNFVRSPTDDPAAIDPAAIAAAIRRHDVFTTTGPFVRWTVNMQPMGSTIVARERRVRVEVDVTAASWIDVDRVHVVVNGRTARTLDVGPERRTTRLRTTADVDVDVDAWLLLLVEGDDPLAPIVHGHDDRPARPIAVTNPVWIDADDAPGWTPPLDAARSLVASAARGERAAAELLERTPPALRDAVVLASADAPGVAAAIVPAALAGADRRIRLCAARTAERVASRAFVAPLERVLNADDTDAYLAIAALRALAAIEPDETPERLAAVLDRHGNATVRRHVAELAPLVGGDFVRSWMVVGYFPAEGDAPLSVDRGPETSPATSDVIDDAGRARSWRAATARPDGFLSLLGLAADAPGPPHHVIAYARTWLHADADRTVLYTFGSDDGARLMLDGAVVYEDDGDHGASPLQHMGRLPLRAGWNRVDVEVRNGTGNFGLYFRVLDDGIEASPAPDLTTPRAPRTERR